MVILCLQFSSLSDVLYVGTTFTDHGDYRHNVPAISSRFNILSSSSSS